MDKRRTRRRHLFYHLDVRDADSGTLLGRVGDLTPDGFLLMCEVPVQPEQDRRLRLVVDSELSDVVEIAAAARCRWCRPNPVSGYDAGFEFLALEPGDADGVRAVIADIAFTDAG